jgi:hypothetical protein
VVYYCGIETKEENGMKHENAEMICAKVNNMNLIMFIKRSKHCEWSVINEAWDLSFITGSNPYSFFLCLPQHKDACLYWLNGGSVQYRIALDVWTDAADNVSNAAWTPDNLFIDDQVEFKIKPKKEKRWIAYSSDQKRLGVLSFYSEQEARDYYIHEVDQPQFIEIEVEV